MQNYSLLASRVLMAYIFIVAGYGKVMNPSGVGGYISSVGLPGDLLALPAGLFELLAGIAILVGFKTRYTAWALAAFCVFTAVVFHGGPQDGIAMMKNLALAGGFLALAVAGAGDLSVDAKFKK